MREHESSEQVEEECVKEWAHQKISKGLTLNVMKCVWRKKGVCVCN